MKKEFKTNAMRMVEKLGCPYQSHFYGDTEAISGMEVAAILGQDPKRVFKTLVCIAKSGSHYVFVIPVCRELDLKKAASAVSEKAMDMLKSKDLLPLTGYVHGGCSPIGMKQIFTTVLDRSAEEYEQIIFSAGKIGYQIEMKPADLGRLIRFSYADLLITTAD